MNKRPATRLMLAVASLLFTPISAFAADSPSPAEKSKLIEPAAKPAIAKPSDALVSKSKDNKQADNRQADNKQAEAKPVDAKAPELKPALSKAADTKSADAKAVGVRPVDAKADAAQTPSGRPINDLKVMPGAPPVQKSGAVPKSGVAPAAEGQSVAVDPLEEKVRGLLQDKLGKDGEVVLRVSPDTPAGKSETTPGKGRVVATKTTEKQKDGDDAAGASTRPGADASKQSPVGEDKDVAGRSKGSADASLNAGMNSSSMSGQHQPWDWSGPRGPQAWGRLDPSYSMCSTGKIQSPPSIAEQQVVGATGPALPALTWQMQGFNWSRQGPLWTAHLEGNSRSMFRGEMFSLDSIQFRFPGEPFVGEKAPAGAVHFIHRQGNRLLIIAVPIEIDAKAQRNAAISTLLRRFPFDSTEKLSWMDMQMDPQLLLPMPMQSAVLFTGSLSYPPCTESVLWLLAHQSLTLPKAQWTELSRLLGEGARPQQALNGRPVLGLRANKP